MSLLDDVSIVVTPNGYKAGELYAVVPVPTEGADEIVDGNFPDGSTAWALNGWTISGNAANCSGITANMIQNISGSTNKQFLITFTISNYISGSVRPAFVGGYGYSSAYNANGVYTTVISSYSDIRFVFYSNSFNGSISNVSVKEYTSADMDVTRATAATRVDENGLVNYAEVIGGEEVTNGDFATDSDWSKFDGTTISGGAMNFNVTTTGTKANQTNVMTSGLLYKVTFEISNYVGGNIYMSGWSIPLAERTEQSNGIFSFYAEASGSTFTVGTTSSSTQLSIDNVSVKEIQRDAVPRIDYTGGGCPHILAEPQRTNLVTYSEDFSQTKWTGSPTTADVTVTTNTNPSGASGTYSVENVTGTQLGSFYTITSGVDYTNSFYVRNISGSGVISLKDINNSGTAFTATSEWQKFSVTGTSNSTTGRIYLSVTTLGDIVEVWGAQLEEGSYATSYIPT